MLEKLAACFERLQRLDIKPTLNNMELLVQTLYDLRDIYNEIGKAKCEEHNADSEPLDQPTQSEV